MNSPEGFLPKKLNFTTQAVQVLWFRPIIVIVFFLLYWDKVKSNLMNLNAQNGKEWNVGVVINAVLLLEC